MKALGDAPGPITEINVTPLVDIILVVLIIFMATAPLIQRRALPVDVPESSQQQAADVEAVQVAYTKERSLFLGKNPVTREQLAAQLEAMRSRAPGLRVLVSADGAVPYREIVGLLDLVRETGLKKVSLEVRAK